MSHKLKLIFFITAIFATSVVLSQTKREIMEEDPKKAANLRLELTPLNFYTSDFNSAADWSVRGSYRANNKFSISGEFRKEIYDEQEEYIKDPSNYTYGKVFKGSAYEFMGTYFFKLKEKEGNEWMPVKKKQIGHNTIEVTVDPVPITKLTMYGVRAGYGSMKSTNELMSAILSEVGNPSNTKSERAVPLQTTNIIFGGLSATRIKNMKVRYPTYGIRRKQVIREYYADFMYGAGNTFSTVSSDGTTYTVNNPTPLTNYGFRIGVLSSPNGKILNLGYGFEVGSFPGSESFASNYYINFRLVFSLFKKAGPAGE
jgi:hypothetical protein